MDQERRQRMASMGVTIAVATVAALGAGDAIASPRRAGNTIQGIGTALLDRRIDDELAAAGIDDVVVGAFATNADGPALYERRGFRRRGSTSAASRGADRARGAAASSDGTSRG